MTTEKTAVALRVLTAINNRRPPDQKDVVLLRAYCPEGRDFEADELACLAIQQALQANRK
jgi:hypothetical protein